MVDFFHLPVLLFPPNFEVYHRYMDLPEYDYGYEFGYNFTKPVKGSRLSGEGA